MIVWDHIWNAVFIWGQYVLGQMLLIWEQSQSVQYYEIFKKPYLGKKVLSVFCHMKEKQIEAI